MAKSDTTLMEKSLLSKQPNSNALSDQYSDSHSVTPSLLGVFLLAAGTIFDVDDTAEPYSHEREEEVNNASLPPSTESEDSELKLMKQTCRNLWTFKLSIFSHRRSISMAMYAHNFFA